MVAVLGRGRRCLEGYKKDNPIVAGIGLMTHPSEWPTLLSEYPVACYLQHSIWSDAIYRPYFGNKCKIWPVGIDTYTWTPDHSHKNVDILIYDKVRWNRPYFIKELIDPIKTYLSAKKLSYQVLQYGLYEPNDFKQALDRCKAVVFLTEHESQGIACQEAMSADLPIFAWDPGFVADPNRFQWGQTIIPATTVPYFSEDCGGRFTNLVEFLANFDRFWENSKNGVFKPRDYILNNLSLEICASRFMEIVTDANTGGSE